MRPVPLELALELKWNVLNSAFVLPCLRGARLAETKDRARLGAFRVDASPCLQRPRGRVGEALRAIQFNIWGDPSAGATGVLVTQIGTNEWIGSSARFADWMVARIPRPSCQALRACTPAGLSFWELQRKERFKIHAPPRESRACDTRHWRAKSQEVHIARALGKLFDAFVLGTRYRASSTRLCQGSFGQRFV